MRDIFVEVSQIKQAMFVPMLITIQQEIRDFPTTWFSPVKAESHNLKSDVSQNPEYWQSYRALAGSPFESSDSDSSSDCEDDALSLRSSVPLSNDVSLLSEGLKTLDVMETNALGLVFMEEDATEAVATYAQQAEGLRAPHYHQDGRSCGHPNQNYCAQKEHVAFQSDGPTDETLVCRFPQDIRLWADVSDDTGPKVSKRSREAVPADRNYVSFSGVPRPGRFSFRGSSLVW
jgi:hypothetical protein